MIYTEQEIRHSAKDLMESFGDLLIWRWEEDKNVLLAEFASGKAETIETILKENYANEWCRKTIKKAPKSLIQELNSFAKLVKEQRVFSNSPKDSEKSVVALLWPWGHGSTLSLRLTLLETPYQYTEVPKRESVIKKILKKLKKEKSKK